jgi:hypothetical protein
MGVPCHPSPSLHLISHRPRGACSHTDPQQPCPGKASKLSGWLFPSRRGQHAGWRPHAGHLAGLPGLSDAREPDRHFPPLHMHSDPDSEEGERPGHVTGVQCIVCPKRGYQHAGWPCQRRPDATAGSNANQPPGYSTPSPAPPIAPVFTCMYGQNSTTGGRHTGLPSASEGSSQGYPLARSPIRQHRMALLFRILQAGYAISQLLLV